MAEIIAEGTIKRIHVNRHTIRHNEKTGEQEPVFSIKNRGRTRRAVAVVIEGPSTFVYAPKHPLPCGAKLWVETQAAVWFASNWEDDF